MIVEPVILLHDSTLSLCRLTLLNHEHLAAHPTLSRRGCPIDILRHLQELAELGLLLEEYLERLPLFLPKDECNSGVARCTQVGPYDLVHL